MVEFTDFSTCDNIRSIPADFADGIWLGIQGNYKVYCLSQYADMVTNEEYGNNTLDDCGFTDDFEMAVKLITQELDRCYILSESQPTNTIELDLTKLTIFLTDKECNVLDSCVMFGRS